MKRVGERGEGKFERISWDEALDTIAKEWTRIKNQYGNDSIYWQYCSGQQSLVSSRRAWQRLMNLMGGYLQYYGSYSNAQGAAAFPKTYGGRPSSLPSEIANAELYVLFGNNPSVTRPSGGGKGFQIDAALTRHRPKKIIVIDPAFTDTCTARADQWIPIRPGTDAASSRLSPTNSLRMAGSIRRSLTATAWGSMRRRFRNPPPRSRTTSPISSARSRRYGKDPGMGGPHHRHSGGCDPEPRARNGDDKAPLCFPGLGPAASG